MKLSKTNTSEYLYTKARNYSFVIDDFESEEEYHMIWYALAEEFATGKRQFDHTNDIAQWNKRMSIVSSMYNIVYPLDVSRAALVIHDRITTYEDLESLIVNVKLTEGL